ncbi:hypothetical protein COSMO_126 [Mycobacterium phage Cosmo]|uniref:Uncharacterized protein n=1 Tax=Mycobacterium phage Cosmo TaxID=1567467 RepID=A0A0B5A528_9CAUD|nr:hypothetical protein COSMO_126 [Mycobacterium phage Cosmo]
MPHKGIPRFGSNIAGMTDADQDLKWVRVDTGVYQAETEEEIFVTMRRKESTYPEWVLTIWEKDGDGHRDAEVVEGPFDTKRTAQRVAMHYFHDTELWGYGATLPRITRSVLAAYNEGYIQ